MKINKLCIYLLLILAGFFIPKVKAEVVGMTDDNTFFGVVFNNSSPLTYYTIPSGTNNYLDIAVGLYNYEGITRPWNYLVIQTCSNGYVARNQVRNSGYTNYFDSSIGYDADITGLTCQMRNGNTGRIGYIQMHVGRYADIDGTGSELSANSYLRIENPLSYSWRMDVMSIMLSSDDLVTELRQNHLLLQVMTSNSNNTAAINNYLATMNSNISSQAQNIINNQNTNAAQAHTDAQNTQNTIKDDSVDSPNSSINTIKGSLASNGVITSLVVLPVTLYQAILNSVNGTCSTFSLGSLFGTNLTIPCINVSNYLGTTLWGSIDVIISGIFIYMISRKMVKVFNQLSSLKEGDVLDG